MDADRLRGELDKLAEYVSKIKLANAAGPAAKKKKEEEDDVFDFVLTLGGTPVLLQRAFAHTRACQWAPIVSTPGSKLPAEIEQCSTTYGLLVLDVSSSMDRYKRAFQEQLVAFGAEAVKANLPANQLTLICFSSHINKITDLGQPLTRDTDITRMSGGTDFAVAFDCIGQQIDAIRGGAAQGARFAISFMTDGESSSWSDALASLHAKLDPQTDTVSVVMFSASSFGADGGASYTPNSYGDLRTVGFPDANKKVSVLSLLSAGHIRKWWQTALEMCSNGLTLRLHTTDGVALGSCLINNNGETISAVICGALSEAAVSAGVIATVVDDVTQKTWAGKVKIDNRAGQEPLALTAELLLQTVQTLTFACAGQKDKTDAATCLRDLAVLLSTASDKKKGTPQIVALRQSLHQAELDLLVHILEAAETVRYDDDDDDDDDEGEWRHRQTRQTTQTSMAVQGQRVQTTMQELMRALLTQTQMRSGKQRRAARALTKLALKYEAREQATVSRVAKFESALVALQAARMTAPSSSSEQEEATRPVDAITMTPIAKEDVIVVCWVAPGGAHGSAGGAEIQAMLAQNLSAARAMPAQCMSLPSFASCAAHNLTLHGVPMHGVPLVQLRVDKRTAEEQAVVAEFAPLVTRTLTAGKPMQDTGLSAAAALFNIIGHVFETTDDESGSQEKLSMALSLAPYAWHLAHMAHNAQYAPGAIAWNHITASNQQKAANSGEITASMTPSQTALLGYAVSKLVCDPQLQEAQQFFKDVSRAYTCEVVRQILMNKQKYAPETKPKNIFSDAEICRWYPPALYGSGGGAITSLATLDTFVKECIQRSRNSVLAPEKNQTLFDDAQAALLALMASVPEDSLRASMFIAKSGTTPLPAVRRGLGRLGAFVSTEALQHTDGWLTLNTGAVVGTDASTAEFLQAFEIGELPQLYSLTVDKDDTQHNWSKFGPSLAGMSLVDFDARLGKPAYRAFYVAFASRKLKEFKIPAVPHVGLSFADFKSAMELYWGLHNILAGNQEEPQVDRTLTDAEASQTYWDSFQLNKQAPRLIAGNKYVRAWATDTVREIKRANADKNIIGEIITSNELLRNGVSQNWMRAAFGVTDAELGPFLTEAPQLFSASTNRNLTKGCSKTGAIPSAVIAGGKRLAIAHTSVTDLPRSGAKLVTEIRFMNDTKSVRSVEGARHCPKVQRLIKAIPSGPETAGKLTYTMPADAPALRKCKLSNLMSAVFERRAVDEPWVCTELNQKQRFRDTWASSSWNLMTHPDSPLAFFTLPEPV